MRPHLIACASLPFAQVPKNIFTSGIIAFLAQMKDVPIDYSAQYVRRAAVMEVTRGAEMYGVIVSVKKFLNVPSYHFVQN